MKCENLLGIIQGRSHEQLKETLIQRLSQPVDPIPALIENAFIETDKQYLSLFQQQKSTLFSKTSLTEKEMETSYQLLINALYGAVGSIAWIEPDYIFTANLGNIGIFIQRRDGNLVELSRRHTRNHWAEKIRLHMMYPEKEKQVVEWDKQVLGDLPVTKAFGYGMFKLSPSRKKSLTESMKHLKLPSVQQLLEETPFLEHLNAIPFIQSYPRTDFDELILFATDNILKKVSLEQLSERVKKGEMQKVVDSTKESAFMSFSL